MRPFCVAVTFTTICCTTSLALAQYQWIDTNGRRVFSDQAPPPDVPADKLLSPARLVNIPDPGPDIGTSSPRDPSEARADPVATTTVATEANRKAADQAQLAQAERVRAINCQRARDYKRTLDSGMRIARLDEHGERVILDDAARDAELQRTENIMADNCSAGR